jgi:hypothetical protein
MYCSYFISIFNNLLRLLSKLCRRFILRRLGIEARDPSPPPPPHVQLRLKMRDHNLHFPYVFMA